MDVFSRILVALDGSAPSVTAVRLALEIAHSQQQTVRFVSVFARNLLSEESTTKPSARIDTDLAFQNDARSCRSALEMVREAIQTAGGDAAVNVRYGYPVDEILEEAAIWNASCIFVGTHGRSGIARMVLGSCADGVLRRSTRPVLVTRTWSARSDMLGCVLCAFDDSPPSRVALNTAITFAAQRNSVLHVVSAVHLDDVLAVKYERDGFDPTGSIHKQYGEARRILGLAVAEASPQRFRLELHVAGGTDVASVIAGCAMRFGCGLIMLGTHGRGGVERLMLGSTSEGVIRDALVPVLAFHDDPQSGPCPDAPANDVAAGVIA